MYVIKTRQNIEFTGASPAMLRPNSHRCGESARTIPSALAPDWIRDLRIAGGLFISLRIPLVHDVYGSDGAIYRERTNYGCDRA